METSLILTDLKNFEHYALCNTKFSKIPFHASMCLIPDTYVLPWTF